MTTTMVKSGFGVNPTPCPECGAQRMTLFVAPKSLSYEYVKKRDPRDHAGRVVTKEIEPSLAVCICTVCDGIVWKEVNNADPDGQGESLDREADPE